jgi:hypothetical protein
VGRSLSLRRSSGGCNISEKVYKESDGVAYFSTTKDGKRDYISVKMKDGTQIYLNPAKGVKITVDNTCKSKDTNPDFNASIKAKS